MREYSTAYVFHGKGQAQGFFNTLKKGIDNGKAFPFNAPHQIALVSGPAADFVAVLVQLEHAKDEGVEVNKAVDSWFEQCGGGGYDDWESLSSPIPGRAKGSIRATLGREYTVLSVIGNI